jgi:hypothetical protein
MAKSSQVINGNSGGVHVQPGRPHGTVAAWSEHYDETG